ncbi:outer membrane autotransporter barrel domain protein [Lasius niger]|uniref:Outer membrane autotransporter barrel domain protein n=1 Tax=Lasius niger TaxID=67767 RepID=A0A0J7KJ84_LASNI|nr:outer membrane autotransporter barrel domain protein [Lasius niger]
MPLLASTCLVLGFPGEALFSANAAIAGEINSNGTTDIVPVQSVSVDKVDIGQNKGDDGTVNLGGSTGQDGKWSPNSPLTGNSSDDLAILNASSGVTVGDAGKGTLNIAQQGLLKDAGPLVIGNQSGSQGTVNITPSSAYPSATIYGTGEQSQGQTETSGPAMVVGNKGAGALNITGDNSNDKAAAMGVNGVTIGADNGSAGNVTVRGANAGMNDNGNLVVGQNNGASGVLDIDQGGQVSISSAAMSGSLNIGQNKGSNGTINVNGSDSALSLEDGHPNLGTPQQSNLPANIAIVGDSGNGNLNVTNGGAVQIQDQHGLIVGNQADGTGTVKVDGGSTVQVSGNTVIGNAGTGTVDVSNKSTYSTGAITEGANGGTGTLKIDGSSVNVGDPKIPASPAAPDNGYVKVGAGSAIDIDNGGSLNINANPTKNADGTISNYPTLQIGTTTGQDSAAVTMDHGNLNVPDGIIQVGDALDDKGNPLPYGAAGAASLTASNSTINGGLQIGVGGNSASSVTLNNSTYNDHGNGVLVGANGLSNTYSQSGGNSTITGGAVVGYRGATDSVPYAAQGIMNFQNGAQVTISNGLVDGLAGDGIVNISGKNTAVSADNVVMGADAGGSGQMTIDDHGTLVTNSATVGDQGTGTLNIDGGNMVVGDSDQPATPGSPDNGYVKVGGGSQINITDGGNLTIDAEPTKNADGSISDYPTLQIGTNNSDNNGPATVNVSDSSINVANGQIQVGDLAGATNDPNATGGGDASLTATGSHIVGGLQVGAGGNKSSSVTLTNSTYNDNGNGVIVGIRGDNNTYTQNGGASVISGGATVGGFSGSSGVMNFGKGAQADISNGLVVGYDAGSKGAVNVNSGSKVSADAIYLGGKGGTGTLSINGQNTDVNVGNPNDPSGPADNSNGYVKVSAGSAVNIDNGGSLNIDAKPTKNADGSISNYPTLQIGTTQGDGAATVTMNNGNLNVANGQIQVGDLAGATNDPNATGGGDASLTATGSHIVGGLQVGAGGNKSSSVTLTNSTYNDNGNGVIVGIRGDNNTYTQNGGAMIVTGNNGYGSSVDIGENTNSSGTMNFNDGANVNITNALEVGINGTGTVNIANSSLQAGTILLGANEGSRGTFNADHANLSAGNVIVGYSGHGEMSLNDGSMANFNNLTISGETSTGTGKVTVDDSQMHVADTTIVGTKSNGTLDIENHGFVTTGSLVVGDTTNATGEVNVDATSTLIIGNNISDPNGKDFILAKGDSSTPVSYTPLSIIGDNADGKVTVNGGQAYLLSDTTRIANDANVKASIDVKNHGSLNARGNLVHGMGAAKMSFDNSSLNAVGDLYDNVDTNLTGQNSINTDNHFVQMDNMISGTGGFNKTGSGTLEMDGKNNNYGGPTNINQGVLQGVGTIGGDLNIAGGATLRPGQSVNPKIGDYGTMQVNGNTKMSDGSIFEANVAGAGPDLKSSIINNTGSFNIGSHDTNLNVKVADGAELTLNQDYELVHADKGVEGKFTNYNQDGKIGGTGAFDYGVIYSTGPSYTKNDVQIRWLFNGERGLGWGGDRNQTNVGNALSPQVGSGGPLSGIANILAGSDNEQRLHNLTQMDGEIASDMRTGNINNNFWVRDSVNNRLDCLEDTFRQIGNGKATTSNVCGVTGKKVNVWGTIYGSQGGQNGHSGWNYATQASDNNAGFIWGVDGEIGSDGYAEDRWHVGMMMGYGSVMESSGGVSSSGESNNANIGMYFGKQVRFDNQNFFTFHGQFGYTWNIMSWHRSVNLQGAAAEYNQTLHANELGGTAHVSAEIAYKHVFNLWGTPLELAPTGSITYLNYEQGSYHETGGNLGLHGAATNTNLGYGFMGAKLATNFNIGNVIVTPHGKFGYRRAFGANQSYTNAGFEALGNSTDMSIVGVPVVQDQALTELGFDVHPTDYLTFGANYVGLYGGHSQTMSGGQLSAKIAF